MGPSYTPPCVEVPEDWKNSEKTPCEQLEFDFWWEVFNDDKLQELEALALENNKDLYVAFERVQEAKDLMGIAASQFYPQIFLNPQYTNTGELIKNYNTQNDPILNNLTRGKNVFRIHELLYFMPVNLSYEVDLWGRIEDQYKSAKYTWFAESKDYEAVMLSLTSSLAIAYYQLRSLDSQIDLLLNVLKTRQKSYEINVARFEEQISLYADVTLAAEEIGTALIQYQESVRMRKVFEDQIAVYIGLPASEFCLESIPLVQAPPCIPAGLPSEMLLRRPDIASAEYVMRSDHQLVKAAYAEFFPSLTLTSAGGFESPVMKHFLQWFSRYWMLGASANQLIFDGFKTPYNLAANIARFNEASGEYQQQVLIAFQEVEDALAGIDSYAKQYDLSINTASWAEKTYTLYRDRYTLGVINYIDVANTERDLLNFQIETKSLLGLRYITTIQFIKALGGSW